MKKQIETYKGVNIYIEMETGKFSADDEVEGEFDTLSEVRAGVRKAKSGRLKAPRIKVLWIDGRYGVSDTITEGLTTGLRVGWNKSQVWVSRPKHGRTQVSVTDVYLDTMENRADLNRVLGLKKEIEKIEEEVGRILNDDMESLDTYLTRGGPDEEEASDE